MRPLRPRGLYLIGGGLLGLLFGLSGCGNSTPEAPTSLGSHEATTPASTVPDSTVTKENMTAQRVAPQHGSGPPATSPSEANSQAVSREQLMREQWYAAARESSDVTVRLQALEIWVQQPGQPLDPVTYGLVDENESVRARAQEVYAQRLAWEETTSVPMPQTEQPIER